MSDEAPHGMAVIITRDGRRHELPMPHAPNHTERVFISGYGEITCWWSHEENGAQIYREAP